MFLGSKLSIANQRKMPLIGKTGYFYRMWKRLRPLKRSLSFPGSNTILSGYLPSFFTASFLKPSMATSTAFL